MATHITDHSWTGNNDLGTNDESLLRICVHKTNHACRPSMSQPIRVSRKFCRLSLRFFAKWRQPMLPIFKSQCQSSFSARVCGGLKGPIAYLAHHFRQGIKAFLSRQTLFRLSPRDRYSFPSPSQQQQQPSQQIFYFPSYPSRGLKCSVLFRPVQLITHSEQEQICMAR